jgi:hypothetical protein
LGAAPPCLTVGGLLGGQRILSTPIAGSIPVNGSMNGRIYVVAYNGQLFSTWAYHPGYKVVEKLPFFDSNPAQGVYLNAPPEPCVVDTWSYGVVHIRLVWGGPMYSVTVENPNPFSKPGYVCNITVGQSLLVMDPVASDIPIDLEM